MRYIQAQRELHLAVTTSHLPFSAQGGCNGNSALCKFLPVSTGAVRPLFVLAHSLAHFLFSLPFSSSALGAVCQLNASTSSTRSAPTAAPPTPQAALKCVTRPSLLTPPPPPPLSPSSLHSLSPTRRLCCCCLSPGCLLHLWSLLWFCLLTPHNWLVLLRVLHWRAPVI
jgi:hypothetical protein